MGRLAGVTDGGVEPGPCDGGGAKTRGTKDSTTIGEGREDRVGRTVPELGEREGAARVTPRLMSGPAI